MKAFKPYVQRRSATISLSVFALAQALALFDFYQARIADCDQQIENSLQLLNADRPRLETPLPPNPRLAE